MPQVIVLLRMPFDKTTDDPDGRANQAPFQSILPKSLRSQGLTSLCYALLPEAAMAKAHTVDATAKVRRPLWALQLLHAACPALGVPNPLLIPLCSCPANRYPPPPLPLVCPPSSFSQVPLAFPTKPFSFSFFAGAAGGERSRAGQRLPVSWAGQRGRTALLVRHPTG